MRSGRITSCHWNHLKQGIGLVGYGQKDPLVEYKKQSFIMFEEMVDSHRHDYDRSLFNLQIVEEQPPEALRQRRRAQSAYLYWSKPGAAAAGEEAGKTRLSSATNPKWAATKLPLWLRQKV